MGMDKKSDFNDWNSWIESTGWNIADRIYMILEWELYISDQRLDIRDWEQGCESRDIISGEHESEIELQRLKIMDREKRMAYWRLDIYDLGIRIVDCRSKIGDRQLRIIYRFLELRALGQWSVLGTTAGQIIAKLYALHSHKLCCLSGCPSSCLSVTILDCPQLLDFAVNPLSPARSFRCLSLFTAYSMLRCCWFCFCAFAFHVCWTKTPILLHCRFDGRLQGYI